MGTACGSTRSTARSRADVHEPPSGDLPTGRSLTARPPEDWMNNALTNCSSTGDRRRRRRKANSIYCLRWPRWQVVADAFRTPLGDTRRVRPSGAAIHCIMNMTTSWRRKLSLDGRTREWPVNHLTTAPAAAAANLRSQPAAPGVGRSSPAAGANGWQYRPHPSLQLWTCVTFQYARLWLVRQS